jgi:hypothetical protein
MASKKKDALAVKEKNTALANWEEELAADAADVSAKEKMPGGNFLSIKGGVMSLAKEVIKGSTIDVVIVASVYENAYYVGDYDPNSPESPKCFAFAEKEEELKPHETVLKKEHDQCSGCGQNAFGTSERGKGKACKNIRRLGMIHADSLKNKDSVSTAEVVYLKVPVTSTKAWALYVKGLANTLKRPPYGVVTTIKAEPDPKNQVKISFICKEPLTDGSLIPALKAKREVVMKEIMFPYSQQAEVEKKPTAGKRDSKLGSKSKKK